MLGVLALRDRLVANGGIEGRDCRSVTDRAVNGGVGIPFEYPSRGRESSSIRGKGYCCPELGLIGRPDGIGGVSTSGEK